MPRASRSAASSRPPLNTGAGGALGQGTLSTVYDPAIQETQIAQALAVFDAQLTTSILFARQEAPANNAFTAGIGNFGAPKYPIVFNQQSETFNATLQKRAANGATFQVAHNITDLYTNSTSNVFPSAYNTNTQLRFTQPLLGGTAQNPSGLEANRAPIIIARITADSAVWTFKAEVMAEVRSIEQQYWALAQQHVQLWSKEVAVELGEEILRREKARLEVGSGSVPQRRRGQGEPGAVPARPGHGHLGRHHHRAPAAQHPGPEAGGQPPDRPGHRPDGGPA